jgi:hypothetical protein
LIWDVINPVFTSYAYSLNLIFKGKTWNRITFRVKGRISEEHAVIATGLALCYHNVKHSSSSKSFDCNTKLSRHIFSNSKLSCERTKAEAIVTNVVAPSKITDFSETL